MNERMDDGMDTGCTDVCMHACMGMARTRLLLVPVPDGRNLRPGSRPLPIVFVSLAIGIEFAIAYT